MSVLLKHVWGVVNSWMSRGNNGGCENFRRSSGITNQHTGCCSFSQQSINPFTAIWQYEV